MARALLARAAAAYYQVRPHPTLRGRWAVVHRVPGTDTLHIDADALTVAGAEREAAWLEAERCSVSTWGDEAHAGRAA